MNTLPKKDKPITIRLDNETYDKIEEIAIKNKTNVSQEVRKMIDFFLDSKQKIEA